jgi:hypothetical protein
MIDVIQFHEMKKSSCSFLNGVFDVVSFDGGHSDRVGRSEREDFAQEGCHFLSVSFVIERPMSRLNWTCLPYDCVWMIISLLNIWWGNRRLTDFLTP